MNIFYLDPNPLKAAAYHNDKHVVKMILEYAQLLSTAHRVLDEIPKDEGVFYKACYINHPCGVWTREVSGNYEFLYDLFMATCTEYTFRYGRKHLSQTKLEKALSNVPNNIEHGLMTKPAQAMPDDVKHKDPVKAYRNYYRVHKQHLAKWTNREVPRWALEKV